MLFVFILFLSFCRHFSSLLTSRFSLMNENREKYHSIHTLNDSMILCSRVVKTNRANFIDRFTFVPKQMILFRVFDFANTLERAFTFSAICYQVNTMSIL